MNQTFASSRNHAAERRRGRVDCRNATVGQSHERHQRLTDILRTSVINRFRSDWFAIRIWEDDGGGQAQLS